MQAPTPPGEQLPEKTFRRLDAPELLAEVADGATYIDGVRIKRTEIEVAA